MKRQELIQRFNKQLVIENYSSQTMKSYSSLFNKQNKKSGRYGGYLENFSGT